MDDAAPSSGASSGWGRADWEVGVGVALGALALGGFAASLALADDDQRLGLASSAFMLSDPGYLRSRDAWAGQRTLSWAFGLGGGVLGALAVTLAMEEEHGTPWWSWVVGGVGLAAAVTGAVLIGTATECGNARPALTCVSASQRVDFGVSTLGMALPLLTVPIVFLLRDALHSGQVTPSIDVTSESAMLHVGGLW